MENKQAFRYVLNQGEITGKDFLEQTEIGINEISKKADSVVENSNIAIDKANQAIDSAVNANSTAGEAKATAEDALNRITEEAVSQTELAEGLATKYDKTGGVLSGSIRSNVDEAMRRTVDNGYLAICGGNGVYASDGAYIELSGSKRSGFNGALKWNAGNESQQCSGIAFPDGRFIWNNFAMEQVVAKGNNYIRFASGLQICWTSVLIESGQKYTTWTFPVAFRDKESFAVSPAYGDYDAQNTVSAGGFESTSCYIGSIGLDGNFQYPRYLRAIAVGLWK